MSRDDSAIRRLLQVDERSLAACRIAVGLVLLIDLAIRISEVEPFLSEAGMLPLDDWQRLRGQQWVWTLYSLSSAPGWTYFLIGAQGFFALLLTAGCWTRAATIASWALALSLHVRNPLITNSGDLLLRMMLFWGMFSPWGQRWSIDSRRRSAAHGSDRWRSPGRPSPWPSCMMLFQVSFMYLVTGWVKFNEVWLGGEALRRVAALDFCIRPWGRVFVDWPELLWWGSVATPWLELLLPLAVWSPWATARIRTAMVLAFIAFHAAIDLTLHVGMFSLATQAAWLVFLPAGFWDRLLPWSKTDNSDLHFQEQPDSARSPFRKAAAGTAHAVCGVAAVVVLFSNWDDLSRPDPTLRQASPSAFVEPIVGLQAADPGAQKTGVSWLLYRLADAGMLHQEWTMFRRPPLHDSWVVAAGTTAHGERVDVLRHGAAVAADGSPRTAHRLPSQHWRYYFRRLTFPAYQSYRQRSAEYLFRAWNRDHPQQAVADLTLLVFIERFGESGYETQRLATVGADNGPVTPDFDLDRALRELDRMGTGRTGQP